jgi:hypothetical protein
MHERLNAARLGSSGDESSTAGYIPGMLLCRGRTGHGDSLSCPNLSRRLLRFISYFIADKPGKRGGQRREERDWKHEIGTRARL